MASTTIAETSTAGIDKKVQQSYGKIQQILDVPNLIQLQLKSFDWFKTKGLENLFEEVSPIRDFQGGRFEISFLDH